MTDREVRDQPADGDIVRGARDAPIWW